MPTFRRLSRRAGPVGVALTMFDLWRKLPPAQRRKLMQATRKHGPKVARVVAKQAKARARAKRPR